MSRFASLALVTALAIGCGAKQPDVRPAVPTPASDAAPITTTAEIRPNPPDPEPVVIDPNDPDAARKQRVADALGRIPKIKEGLAELRELAFVHDVPAMYQSTDDFRAFVTGEVTEELAPEKAASISTALAHLGLLAAPIDLAKTMSDAFVSQAAAYYDPDQKKFFVVIVPEQELGLDIISAHELTHALQDQHFDLKQYMSPKTPLDDDQANARKFVVEGEATLTMFVYAMRYAGDKQIDPLHGALPLLKLGLGTAANMSIDDFKKQIKLQQGAAADPEIQKSVEAMDAIPPIILVPMLDSYMKGAMAVLAAFETGGWDQVATLYSDPPQSTEQMLHPTTKLVPTRDLPTHVTLPQLPGLTELEANTVGELGWRVFFGLWKAKQPEAAAEGWDGDRWSVAKTADGALVGLIATAWDSPAEAKQFAKAYQAAGKVRFPKRQRKIWVKTQGDKVFVVDGGKDAKLIDALAKGATFQ